MLNRPVVFASDLEHSQTEPRFFTLGRNDSGRHLAIVFTTRGHRVRVISARPMSRAERRAYGQSKASVVSLPNLKPSTETISLRLPAPLLSDLKALANKRDVPLSVVALV